MLVGSHWYKGFSVFSDSIRTRLVDIISSWQRLEFIVYRDHEGRVHITQQFQLEINPMAQNTELSIRTAAKSLQSCQTLCNPTDGSPPGSPIPGILQARTLEWVAISFSNAAAAAAKSLQSCPTLCDPIDGSPPGSPISGILQARTLEWVAIRTTRCHLMFPSHDKRIINKQKTNKIKQHTPWGLPCLLAALGPPSAWWLWRQPHCFSHVLLVAVSCRNEETLRGKVKPQTQHLQPRGSKSQETLHPSPTKLLQGQKGVLAKSNRSRISHDETLDLPFLLNVSNWIRQQKPAKNNKPVSLCEEDFKIDAAYMEPGQRVLFSAGENFQNWKA